MNERHDRIKFDKEDFQLLVCPDRRSFVGDIREASGTWHEEFEIKYFTAGTSTVLIDTKSVNAEAGDIVIINPYELHSTLDDGDGKGAYHLFMIGMDLFSSHNLDRFDMKMFFGGGRLKFNNLIKNNKRAQRILLTIVEEVTEKAQSYELAVRGLLLELFAILMRSEINDVLPVDYINDNVRFYESIEPAIQLIRSNYTRKLSLDELAHACKISKHHFCRIFKRATGMTVIEYTNAYRMMIADVLLRNSSDSITDIAALCGFDDESYFSRCYKKVKGISPQKARAILSK